MAISSHLASLFFLLHTVYEGYAAYINIFRPEVFNAAEPEEMSIRWQAGLGCCQASLALLTLLFCMEAGDATRSGGFGLPAGAKVGLAAGFFHVLVVLRMYHAGNTGGVPFVSHAVI